MVWWEHETDNHVNKADVSESSLIHMQFKMNSSQKMMSAAISLIAQHGLMYWYFSTLKGGCIFHINVPELVLFTMVTRALPSTMGNVYVN